MDSKEERALTAISIFDTVIRMTEPQIQQRR